MGPCCLVLLAITARTLGHFKDNCVRLNNKIAWELAQDQAAQKASDKPGSGKTLPKK